MSELRTHLQRALDGAFALERELYTSDSTRSFVANDLAGGRQVVLRRVDAEGSTRSSIERFLREVKRLGKLPVVNFSAGGVATPADAALMMQLGAEGVFVGSGIFKAGLEFADGTDSGARKVREVQAALAQAIVKAVTHYNDPAMLAEVSRGISSLMPGRAAASLPLAEQLAARGN